MLGAGCVVSKVSRLSEGSRRSRAGDYSGSLQAALARANSTAAMVVNGTGNRSGASGDAVSWALLAAALTLTFW